MPGQTNKHKHKGQMVSYNDSSKCSGCHLYPNLVTYSTADCNVVQCLMDNMKATYAAQPYENGYKHQKTSNSNINKNSTTGDLHTLLDTVEQVANVPLKAANASMKMVTRKEQFLKTLENTIP